MNLFFIKKVLVFTLLCAGISSSVFSQKEPTENYISKTRGRKYGIRIGYGPILFPKRDTLAYYVYSRAYNVAFCTEKISERNPLKSTEFNFGYGIYDFHEKISALDTNVTVKPYVSKKFNNVYFTYDHLFVQFTLKNRIGKFYVIGSGFDLSVYCLRKKGGYEPISFSFWEQNSSGQYSRASVSRDYTYSKSFVNLYLKMDNQIRIDRNHSLGLTLSFNPYDFINIQAMRQMPTYPLQPGNSNRKVLGGPSFEAVCIALFYYRVMF